MSIPRDHHYIPCFYLKRWAGNDGQLWEYKLVRSRVHLRKTYPRGTGYKRDLYRIDGLPDHLAHRVESKFMHMVDTYANLAAEKLIRGDRDTWDAKLRDGWARFILSLRFRNPEAVDLLKVQMKAVWEAGLENLRVNYAAKRRPTDPTTFEEFLARTEVEAPQKAALILLQQIIDNDRVGPHIIKMRWTRVNLHNSRFSLLTSDRPIYMPVGLSSNDAGIFLPVAPKVLFVADHDGGLAARFGRGNHTKVVTNLNQFIVEQARKFVWGRDPSHLRFVQNHIARSPDHPILSDERRQAAIDATAKA